MNVEEAVRIGQGYDPVTSSHVLAVEVLRLRSQLDGVRNVLDRFATDSNAYAAMDDIAAGVT